MDILSSVILGVIQGITEFLPVSSSGHLVLGQFFLGIREPELFFDVVLHVATLMVVLWFFRHDIAKAVFEVIEAIGTKEGKLHSLLHCELTKVVIATVPLAVVGLLGRSFIEGLFSDPKFVAYDLIITGFFLISTRFRNARQKEVSGPGGIISWKQALLVGFFQIFALAPGISRSGITISVALLSGCSREDSARFSFLLFIPAAVGAFVLEVSKVDFSNLQWTVVAAGFASALISGYVALKWLIRLIKRGAFYRFAFYCWTVGLLTLILVG